LDSLDFHLAQKFEPDPTAVGIAWPSSLDLAPGAGIGDQRLERVERYLRCIGVGLCRRSKPSLAIRVERVVWMGLR